MTSPKKPLMRAWLAKSDSHPTPVYFAPIWLPDGEDPKFDAIRAPWLDEKRGRTSSKEAK